MNSFIKFSIFAWLLVCTVAIWATFVLLEFMCMLNGEFLYATFMPLVGIPSSICILVCAILVIKSNPLASIKSYWESLIGKETV